MTPRIALAALAILLLPAPSAGHDAASWIQEDPSYVTPQGSHCCGPSDCEAAPDGAVAETAPGVWFIPSTGQTFRQGEKGVYPAIRPKFWWCKRGGKVVCFFYEGGAT